MRKKSKAAQTEKEKKKEKKKRIHNHIRVAPTFFWSLYLKAIFEIARKALAL